MRPLSDITIYELGINIPKPPYDFTYRKEMNFVSELYHSKLYGYKPQRTSRICLNANQNKKDWDSYCNGSIVHINSFFDAEKFLSLTKIKRYNYLLDFIQSSVIKLSEYYNWDRKVFENAYKEVKASNFVLLISSGKKKSRDRKKIAEAILEKDELVSSLSFKITILNKEKTIKVIEKGNTYPMDETNFLLKKCKWIDNDKFGYQPLNKSEYLYYDFSRDTLVRKFEFWIGLTP
jgi:hypothetical protein